MAPHFKLTWKTAGQTLVWFIGIPLAIHNLRYAPDWCDPDGTLKPSLADMDRDFEENGVVDPLPPKKKGVHVPDRLPPPEVNGIYCTGRFMNYN